MEYGYNELNKKINDKNIPSSWKKGIIVKINEVTWTADVQIIGSINTVARNVPISLAVATLDIQINDKCKLDVFDESNSNDMVIAYTYGRRPAPVATPTGFATTALTNLASVAINTALISDTDNTDDLGSSSKKWKDAYIAGTSYLSGKVKLPVGTNLY